MRHFDYLSAAEIERLFLRPPQPFGRSSDLAVLAVALGATLYSPATRATLARDLEKSAAAGITSMVVCLEDAISDDDVEAAEHNVVEQLRVHEQGGTPGPLTFVRVRAPGQISRIIAGLGQQAGVLAGFVLPKFTEESGAGYLDALDEAENHQGPRLLAMPVIESPEVIYRESRTETLLGIRRLLDKHRDRILAVRVGATDLCSAFGIRRDRELTIYDLPILAEVIADIVNALGRADRSGYVVTGPVWEYFGGHERLFKPQLRQSVFDGQAGRRLRQDIITRDLDGLIREIVLDKANGLTGKTIIHPSHACAVHALSVVTHEEFSDARDIIGSGSGGGAQASSYQNKMNETKPHRAWAERVLRRAEVFGVAAEGIGFVELLGAAQAA